MAKEEVTHRGSSLSLRKPWTHLYKRAEWKRLRARHLKEHPLCAICLEDGYVVPAETVDHKKPHRGNMVLFRDPSNLQSLCYTHHSGDKQKQDIWGYSAAVGVDGWPIDPRHPINRK